MEFPIHPIDTVQAAVDRNNNIFCFSGFIVSDPDPLEGLYLIYVFLFYFESENSPTPFRYAGLSTWGYLYA